MTDYISPQQLQVMLEQARGQIKGRGPGAAIQQRQQNTRMNQLLGALSRNDQTQTREMNQLIQSMGGNQQFQSPAAQQAYLGALSPQEAKVVGAGGALIGPQGRELYRNPNFRQGPESQTTINMPEANNQYVQERMSQSAEGFAEAERQAQSAYEENLALDRFIEASPDALEGGAQPLIHGAQNFLATFGYDSDSLQAVATMDQAIALMLAQDMREMGARGLTDQDMKILREARPRINISEEARVEVANILKKANYKIMNDYKDAIDEEDERFPDNQFRRLPWSRGYERYTFDDPNAGWSVEIIK